MHLSFFDNKSLFAGMQSFFEELNIPVNCITEKPVSPQKILSSTYKADNAAHQLISTVYFLGMIDDNAFENVEEGTQLSDIRKDYDGLLVFGVELKEREKSLLPARGQLAEITRCFNREYHYTPVVVIFIYSAGNEPYISFTSCERVAYKQEWREGEKAGRVSILKDVRIRNPHSGHSRILDEMAIERTGKKAVNSFAELNKYWQAVFSIQILNQAFYDELFNWYLWACKTANFPKPSDDDTVEKAHTSISVIRMLTRMIFCWFIKEKCLLPESLFEPDYLSNILKKFDPSSEDKSDYYIAILQNLFFATLNTEMPKDVPGSRRFQKESDKNGRSDDYLDHLVYRYEDKFTDSKKALDLFSTIPFLNGGLFECLDSRDIKTGKEYRYDGFSRFPAKQPRVPNVLFFGEDDNVDLSDDFDGDKKKKHVLVRGLIKILNSYKFTIAENTPLEQEIALDPELLGKVFENLLASYNPETKTTARKQTGSFYTPREIVNYMVDESLISYLKTKLAQAPEVYEEIGARGQLSAFGNEVRTGQTKLTITHHAKDAKKEKEREEKLRRLFDFSMDENPFASDEDTNDRIIEHLSNCRILDPACGSGAFPMGALHKMVFVLCKLDPNNKKWKQAQLNKAERDLDAAKKMEDAEIREKAVENAKLRIDYIKESFDKHEGEFDYSRKLFLIENCIYGVDIQNIAVQISKLRFFISLMVDQCVDIKKQNYAILSLPNLETKFVAANTLYELDKPQQTFLQAIEVDKLEKELREIRQRIFFTRKYLEKKKLKKLEYDKREQLKEALVSGGYGKGTADKISGWNPFDPIHSASFFDIVTMFGFESGFDIVIGNPPYVRVDEIKTTDKIYYNKKYKSATGKYDLYYLFLEKGLSLLAHPGVCSYITPNKYCAATSAINLREMLFSGNSMVEILSTSKLGVFEDAANYPVITRVIKPAAFLLSVKSAQAISSLSLQATASYTLSLKELNQLPERVIPINVSSKQISLALNCLNKFKKLGKVFSISEGLRIPSAYETEDKKGWHIVKQYQFERYSSVKPGAFILNKNFERLISETSDRYRKIMRDKIIIAEDALVVTATIDKDKSIPQGGVYFGVSLDPQFSLEIFLCLLNSYTVSGLYKILFEGMHMGGGYLRFRTSFLEAMPIPFKDEIPSAVCKEITCGVNKLLSSKDLPKALPLESHLDALVAHLYKLTEEEYTIILDDLKLPDPVRIACLNEYREIARTSINE